MSDRVCASKSVRRVFIAKVLFPIKLNKTILINKYLRYIKKALGDGALALVLLLIQ